MTRDPFERIAMAINASPILSGLISVGVLILALAVLP